MKDNRIIYKILKTLDRFQGSEGFENELISAKQLKIPFEKWEQIVIQLQKSGYIEGIVYMQTLSDRFPHIAEPIKPNITIKGMEYLENNSTMNKAKEELKLIGEFF